MQITAFLWKVLKPNTTLLWLSGSGEEAKRLRCISFVPRVKKFCPKWQQCLYSEVLYLSEVENTGCFPGGGWEPACLCPLANNQKQGRKEVSVKHVV